MGQRDTALVIVTTEDHLDFLISIWMKVNLKPEVINDWQILITIGLKVILQYVVHSNSCIPGPRT